MITVLVVGGSADTVKGLSLILKVRWPDLQLIRAEDSTKALQAISTHVPSFVLICADDTFAQWSHFVAEARASYPHVLLLIVSPESSPANRILAFEMGANDWLQSDGVPMEIIARVNTWLRRTTRHSEDSGTRCQLHIQRNDRVDVDGRVVFLSPREHHILSYLAERPGAVVPVEELVDAAWRGVSEGDSLLLRQIIFRLRQKLASDGDTRELIRNQRGSGYMLAASCTLDDSK